MPVSIMPGTRRVYAALPQVIRSYSVFTNCFLCPGGGSLVHQPVDYGVNQIRLAPKRDKQHCDCEPRIINVDVVLTHARFSLGFPALIPGAGEMV